MAYISIIQCHNIIHEILNSALNLFAEVKGTLKLKTNTTSNYVSVEKYNEY